MKNRAKCKLCNDILESKFGHDFVTCSCGSLSIDGGPNCKRVMYKNMNNFCFINDDDEEYHFKGLKIPAPKEDWISKHPDTHEVFSRLKRFLDINNLPAGTFESVINFINGAKNEE
jgi:hypothetical protein